VKHKSPSTTVILIASEALVFLKVNLTRKHCVYTDSCVYRVIVLGCYKSHGVYICVHVYISVGMDNTIETHCGGLKYRLIEEHDIV